MQHLELKADARLREALVENADLRLELARLEMQTNHLQGYGLDDTSAEDLARLIESLTQVITGFAQPPEVPQIRQAVCSGHESCSTSAVRQL